MGLVSTGGALIVEADQELSPQPIGPQALGHHHHRPQCLPDHLLRPLDHLLLLHIEDSHCSVFVTDCQLFLRPFDTADTPFRKFLSLVAAPTPNIGYIAQRYCYQVILVPVQQVIVEVIL